MKKDIKQITFCGLISALSVALMFLSTIFCYSSLIGAACCGYLNLIVAKETKISRAFCSYFIVITLASLFVARKSILINYAIFNGIYPIVETKISNIKNISLRFVFKCLIFSLCSLIIINFNLFILGLNNMPTKQVQILGYVSMFAWCFCFDFFLQDVKNLYITKIRPQILKQLN